MEKILYDLVNNKKVLILGYGREGKATLNALMKVGGCKTITVSDVKDVSAMLPESVQSVSGDGYLDVIDDYDVVFKSPGIVLKKAASQYKALITSETEVFFSRFKSQIIGVTGTKGKSTTSSLIYHVLKTAGKNTVFGGNIGIPVFDLAESISDDTIIVMELSCHQLEYVNLAPGVAVLLNIYEDHLDHYGTRERYVAAKKNIFLKQTANDVLYTTRETVEKESECPSKCIYVEPSDVKFTSFEEVEGATLRGQHNVLNAAFAYDVCARFGVSYDCFIKALSTFKTLPHRLEYIGNVSGIDYYDDSISTTVKSAISAVESVNNAAILLVGGMERNIDYTELVEYVAHSRLKWVVCMYESGARFYGMYTEYVKKFESPVKAVCVNDLVEAVSFCKKNAVSGDACMLSPAAASYGYFTNFEERGDKFKELVNGAQKN